MVFFGRTFHFLANVPFGETKSRVQKVRALFDFYFLWNVPFGLKMKKAKKTVMASSHPKIACFQPLSPLVSAVSFSGDELARGKFKVTP